MNQRTQSTIRAAQNSITRLVDKCRKDGPLYAIKPKIVAHVSRTAKWLLNAIATLNQELARYTTKENNQ